MVSALRRLLPLLITVLVVSLCLSSFAQRGGRSNVPTTRGNVPIQLSVQVTRDGSRGLDMQVSVELLSNAHQISNTVFTDINGRAQLAVPGPGSYQVRVSGPNIEDTTSGTFSILTGEFVHNEYITVKLKPNVTNSESAPGTEGTVSAEQLKVPEKARNEYTKGVEEMHKKNWKPAREHFERATREYDKFDWAYNALGVVCIQLGDKPAAHTAFAKAFDINERNAGAERNLARIMIGEHDFVHAEEHARHSQVAEPQNGDALTLEAFAELQQGKYDAALASARRVHSAEKHPFPFSHLIAARALEAKKMNDQAAAEYRTYLSESPNAPEATLARQGLQRIGAK